MTTKMRWEKEEGSAAETATDPSKPDKKSSLAALSLVALPGLAGLRHDFDLGLLRLILLRDRPTLAAAVVLPALTGLLPAHL